jgi:hypothetical protein
MMLVLHDDAKRLGEGADPAGGEPSLYDEAKKKSWAVISMKNDWKRIFAFEQSA